MEKASHPIHTFLVLMSCEQTMPGYFYQVLRPLLIAHYVCVGSGFHWSSISCSTLTSTTHWMVHALKSPVIISFLYFALLLHLKERGSSRCECCVTKEGLNLRLWLRWSERNTTQFSCHACFPPNSSVSIWTQPMFFGRKYRSHRWWLHKHNSSLKWICCGLKFYTLIISQ